MFQYLPHRRRLCDEPNQAHPPAALAALEWKYPVDTRQQLWRVSATESVSVGELRRGVRCLCCMGMVMPGIHVALGDYEDGHAQKHRPVAPHR